MFLNNGKLQVNRVMININHEYAPFKHFFVYFPQSLTTNLIFLIKSKSKSKSKGKGKGKGTVPSFQAICLSGDCFQNFHENQAILTEYYEDAQENGTKIYVKSYFNMSRTECFLKIYIFKF